MMSKPYSALQPGMVLPQLPACPLAHPQPYAPAYPQYPVLPYGMVGLINPYTPAVLPHGLDPLSAWCAHASCTCTV